MPDDETDRIARFEVPCVRIGESGASQYVWHPREKCDDFRPSQLVCDLGARGHSPKIAALRLQRQFSPKSRQRLPGANALPSVLRWLGKRNQIGLGPHRRRQFCAPANHMNQRP